MHPIESLQNKRDHHKALAKAYEEGVKAVDVAFIMAAKIITAHKIEPETCSNKAEKLSAASICFNNRLDHLRRDILDCTSEGPRGSCDTCLSKTDDDIPF